MKKKAPIWLISFLTLTIIVFCAAAYVYSQREDSVVTLTTCTGDPSILNGIELNLDTQLSDQYDMLYTNVTLGKELTVTSTYDDSYFYLEGDDPYQENDVYIFDDIYETTSKKVNEFKNQTILYGDYFDTIPFTISYYLEGNGYSLAFPYIDIAIPDDLSVTYTYDDWYINNNYSFDFNTSNLFTIGDKSYFTIKNLNIYKDSGTFKQINDVSYTVNSGIFKIDKNRCTQLYSYAFTNEKSCRTLDLISLDGGNKLGLLVMEDNVVILKIFDFSSDSIEKEITLGEVPAIININEYNNADYNLYYNASSNTFVVKSYTTKTDLSETEVEKLIRAYDTDDTSTITELEEHIIYSTDYYCYTVDSNLDLTYQTYFSNIEDTVNALDLDTDNELSEYGMDGSDFIYKDGILFILCFSRSYDCSFPSLFAVKDGSIIYSGYIKTNLEDDYISPSSYNQDGDINSEQDYYDLFQTQHRCITSSSLELQGE